MTFEAREQRRVKQSSFLFSHSIISPKTAEMLFFYPISAPSLWEVAFQEEGGRKLHLGVCVCVF